MTRWLLQLTAVLLVATPWINPLSFGPSGSTFQWLVTLGCLLPLWFLWAKPVSSSVGLTCAVVFVWAALLAPDVGGEVLALGGGLLVICLSTGLGANISRARDLQSGLLVAAVLSALMGLAQYFGASSAFVPFLSPTEAGVAVGNLRQPNQFATLCSMGIAVLIFGTLNARPAVTTALVILLSSAVAASASRTGVLEGLALAVLALWPGPHRRQRLTVCAVAGIGYGMAAWALPTLLEAVTGTRAERLIWSRFGADYGCQSRGVLWSNVVDLVKLRPITGWGWGELDYAHFTTTFAGTRFCSILDNAHNLPLHLAVELGIPAALVICAGLAAWLCRERPWRETVPLRQLALAMLAVLLLHSMLEYPLWYGPFQMALGVCIGWLLPRQVVTLQLPHLASRHAGLAVVLLAVVGYTGWDYLRVSQVYTAPEQRLPWWREDPQGHARRSLLFSEHARFAELTLASPSRANASWMNDTAREMLHYSPEPRVIERLIESAVLLGREEEALIQLARYKAAFLSEYEQWRGRHRLPDRSPP